MKKNKHLGTERAGVYEFDSLLGEFKFMSKQTLATEKFPVYPLYSENDPNMWENPFFCI